MNTKFYCCIIYLPHSQTLMITIRPTTTSKKKKNQYQKNKKRRKTSTHLVRRQSFIPFTFLFPKKLHICQQQFQVIKYMRLEKKKAFVFASDFLQ